VQGCAFEHPGAHAVVVTAPRTKILCDGANIRMLAARPTVEVKLLQV